ncbi:MAG: flippase [Paludibacteraceae bacterium]|nr:flippase [Paludibacteraceae bacterium]
MINRIVTYFHLNGTKQKIVRNLIWAMTGKIVTLLGSFLVGIIVARYLGPEQYGIMSYVISYIAIFQVVANFGLEGIEIREEAKEGADRDVLVGTAFTLKCLLAIITIGITGVTVMITEQESYVRWLIMLYSISMVLNSFSAIRNYFTALIWNEYVVKTEIMRTLIGAGVKIALLLCKASLVWFIVALLFDSFLIASGYVMAYQKKIASIRKWRIDKATARYYIYQSFPLFLSAVMTTVYMKVDQLMIGNMLNKTSTGIYAVACTFVEICIFIPTILSQTITPVLVNNYQQDKEVYREKAQIFMNITTWICILIAVLISLSSPLIIRYSYGLQYMAAVPVLQLLIFRLIGVASAQISGQLIIIEQTQKYAILRNTAGCIVCIVLNLILLPLYGLYGAAISAVVTSLVAGLIIHLFIPAYRSIFKQQIRCLAYGWKDLIHAPQLLRL